MSRNSRRAVAIAVAGVFAVAPLVSACAAGQHPQSALPTQLAEGVNATANGVDLRNVFLLGPAPGQRLAAGGSAPLYAWFVNKTASPDRLIAVEAAGVARSVEIAGGAVTLPPGRLVATVQPPGTQASATPSTTPSTRPSTTPTAAKSRAPKSPQGRTPTPGASAGVTATPGTPATPATPAAPEPSKVVLKDLTKDYVGGETVRLILHFQRAGAVTLNVLVVPQSGNYATYSPAPAEPAPSATPLPTPPKTTASATPKPGKSKKPSATPSA